jgi:hypothetical protein
MKQKQIVDYIKRSKPYKGISYEQAAPSDVSSSDDDDDDDDAISPLQPRRQHQAGTARGRKGPEQAAIPFGDPDEELKIGLTHKLNRLGGEQREGKGFLLKRKAAGWDTSAPKCVRVAGQGEETPLTTLGDFCATHTEGIRYWRKKIRVAESHAPTLKLTPVRLEDWLKEHAGEIAGASAAAAGSGGGAMGETAAGDGGALRAPAAGEGARNPIGTREGQNHGTLDAPAADGEAGNEPAAAAARGGHVIAVAGRVTGTGVVRPRAATEGVEVLAAAATAAHLGTADNSRQHPTAPVQRAPLPPTLQICAKFSKPSGTVEGVLDVARYEAAKGSPCVTLQLDGATVTLSLNAFVEKAKASLAQPGEKVSKVGTWKNNVFVVTAQGAAYDLEKLFAWLQRHGLN